jgi:hypothetical protein
MRKVSFQTVYVADHLFRILRNKDDNGRQTQRARDRPKIFGGVMPKDVTSTPPDRRDAGRGTPRRKHPFSFHSVIAPENRNATVPMISRKKKT